MKLTAVIGLIVAVSGANDASAGYVNNKSTWDPLSQAQKEAYAMGAFDIWHLTDADADTLAYKNDIADCVVGLSLTSTQLVRAIDTEYNDLSSWDRPPIAVLLSGLRKVCLAQVNRARAERGETPLQ
jgi:hypothetical protein